MNIFLPVKAFFWRSKNVFFLTNPSIRLVESEFLFSGNNILLFTAFILLFIALIKKTLFPLDRKSVPTSQMKCLLRKRYKRCFHFKNLRISENIGKTGVHKQEYISSLKFDSPQVSIIATTS